MKIMKKSLAMLLTAAIIMSTGVVFVSAETPMTAIPAAPAVENMYVRVQADASVVGSGNAGNPKGYARGIFIGASKAPTGSSKNLPITISDSVFYIGEATSSATTDNMVKIPRGRRIVFEGATEGAETTVNSGYLMVHNNEVCINAPTETANTASFGFTLESNITEVEAKEGRIAQFEIEANNGAMNLAVRNEKADSVDRLSLADWIKPGDKFDLKLLINLDTDTYDIYINDRPVSLSLKSVDKAVGMLAITGRTDEMSAASMYFKTTECYSISADNAAQYRQAAIERAFNRSFTEDTAEAMLFYAYGGEKNGTTSKEYDQHVTDTTAYKALSCDNVINLQIVVGSNIVERHRAVYFTADNMTAYDYDNLEYVYVSAPVVVNETATVSGIYEVAGGKGMEYKPTVITALYTDANKTVLDRVTCGEDKYGTYSCTLEVEEGEDLDSTAASAFIWGGKSKLVPLFPRVDFE
ncbi:MAG: hypothetical protein IKB93_15730 [Clostridia bacterium]|nr:hypothetical protein [Clostridia bacterium]